MENIHSTFEKIVKNKAKKDIYPFLERLSKKERRDLIKSIRKADKYYFDFIQNGNTWSSRGTADQHKKINIAYFVCLTDSEILKKRSLWLQKEEIEKIFEFYIPDWFTEYVNKHVQKEDWAIPFQMDYAWMMELESRGILNPEPQLIVKLLCTFPFVDLPGNGQYRRMCNAERLKKYPETLKTHIWLLFEEESNIHWIGHYDYQKDKNGENTISWKSVFSKLLTEELIDRNRLLKACLTATCNNFNKPLTSWYIELFDLLVPSTQEKLALQDDMMSVLNCTHSKPINLILKHFKKLCIEKEFNLELFLDYVSVLLSNEVKGIVNSCLMIMDKLAKMHKSRSSEICKLATLTFIQNDHAIQIRAAKLILKYGDIEEKELAEEISLYQEDLLMETKTLLSDFLPEESYITIEEEENLFQAILSDQNKIETPKTADELMFFASQVFENHNPGDLEIFIASLVEYNHVITKENVSRFEPALQRAAKVLTWETTAKMGMLEHMLAAFFMEYIDILIRRFPEGTIELKKIREKFIKLDTNDKSWLPTHPNRKKPLKNWFDKQTSLIYKPFYLKLCEALEMIENEVELPLLSTPTHFPCWIDPSILVSRIKKWQDSNQPLNNADFQIAISRTYLVDAKEMLNLVEKELSGEEKELLVFLLNKEASPVGSFNHQNHWWTAAITKDAQREYSAFKSFPYSATARENYTGNFSWKMSKEPYRYYNWDYQNNSRETINDFHKTLEINTQVKSENSSLLKSISKISFLSKAKSEFMIYDFIDFKGGLYTSYENDIKRLLSLTPNNPEVLYAKIIKTSLKYVEFPGEDARRSFINTLEYTLDQPLNFGPMGHLLIAGGMLCSDKTARLLAGEIWIKGVTKGIIDNTKLGVCIGKHFNESFSPLKRFTDLLSESMMRVSDRHNHSVQELLENSFCHMNNKPVRGLKKMLELYAEIVSRNGSVMSNSIKGKIIFWESNKGLQKVLNQIKEKELVV